MRKYMTGFESGSIDLEISSYFSGTYSYATDRVRTGTYALKIASGNTAGILYGGGGGGFARVYFYLDSNPATARPIMGANAIPDTSVNYLRLNTDRTVSLVLSGGTVRATSTAALTLGSWTRVEVNETGTAPNIVVDVRFDGVTAVTYTGSDTWNLNYVGVGVGSLGADLWLDDFASNDTAGSYNTSWCGPGAIVELRPGSDTATINWTSTGASHYTEVDDVGTIDTTTYVSTTSKTDQLEDRWNLTDTPAAVTSASTISAIHCVLRGGGDGSTTRPAKLKIIDGVGNSSEYSVDWNLNGWQTVRPTGRWVSPFVLERTITDGAALSKSYVDGLMAAVVDDNTSTRLIRFTGFAMAVDFTTPPDTSIPPFSRVQFYRPKKRRTI
jgi:hypothetical protein